MLVLMDQTVIAELINLTLNHGVYARIRMTKRSFGGGHAMPPFAP